jgi:hypothetical protein
VHPLGCLPLWGRVGVTLQKADKRKRIIRKWDFNRARISRKKLFKKNLMKLPFERKHPA